MMIPDAPTTTSVKAQPRRRKRPATTGTPYASATSGGRAREEISKVLRRLGCESIGFMDDFEKQELFLAFKHRGRQVQWRASAKGWAQMYLKANPYNGYRRCSRI